jgi:serine protease Do
MKTSLKQFISVAVLVVFAALPVYSQKGETPASSKGEALGVLTTFAPIVVKVAPSVVSIHTTQTVHVPEEFSQFFGIPGSEKRQGLGSGVIVSADGYIVTNAHVVAKADEILVTLGEERKEYKAKKVGVDKGTDIAVLKIDAKNLPMIAFTDGDNSHVGDVVLAIGNPFGLTQTVTMGIISGKGRAGMGLADYENFIQTDASINPGNSGGALVNTEGKLVGINTAIYSPSGGNMGIGFAVPSDLAASVLKSIREKGRVTRGYLGIGIQAVTQELADAFKLKEASGALVSDVPQNGPAAKAGIQQGDVIVAVNRKKIDGPRELRLMISGMEPGTKAEIRLIRNGQQKDVQAELTSLPEKQEVASSGATPNPSSILNGVVVSDLDDDARRAIHAPLDLQGAVIIEINPASAAYRSGLRQGSVIQQINQQPVKSAKDVDTLIEKAKSNEPVLLLVWTGGQTQYLTLPAK